MVFSSGMAAAAAMVQTLKPGSHVIFSDDIYIDIRNLARDFLPAWGIDSSIENLQDLDALTRAVRPSTKLIWIETPSNPLLKILDIQSISHIARQAGALLLVDNTFATPIRVAAWLSSLRSCWTSFFTFVRFSAQSRLPLVHG